MSELTNLMKTVVGNPADDLPRLVLADWFDENGQPERAEFVRVQIELEQRAAYCPSHFVTGHLKTCEPCSARRRLENRERKLFRNHGRGWFVDLPGTQKGMAWGHKSTRLSHLDTTEGVQFGFWRGFVSEVRCDLSKWIGGCVACRPPSAQRPNPKQPCPSCGGHIGPLLVAAHPITLVAANDRTHLYGTAGTRLWVRVEAGETSDEPEQQQLPAEVWDLLPASGRMGDGWWGGPEPKRANEFLSTALIEWAGSTS